MSEAVVELKEILNLLTPAFKKQLVRVVWDEHKATVTVVKKEPKKTLKAYGSLCAYADPSKIATEKEAWSKAAAIKNQRRFR